MLNPFKIQDDFFRMIRDGRCGTIVFDNGEKKCEIYYEMSGVPESHILVSFDTLKYWVIPKGSFISHDEKEQLRIKLVDWLTKEGIKAEL